MLILFARKFVSAVNSELCQIEVLGYEDDICTTTSSYDGNNIKRIFSTTIEETGGIIKPFNWTNEVYTYDNSAAKVRSLEYTPSLYNDDSNNCKPMQLMVYDHGYISGVKYFTPGKGPAWCMFFPDNATSTFTAYNGVNILIPMDKTYTIGDGDEDGSYMVPMCIGCSDLKYDINPIRGSSEIGVVASATNTLISPSATLQTSVSHDCDLIVGCAYHERHIAEFLGTSVTNCNSKCNENLHCKAYEYGADHDGSVWCNLLDANATNSYTPMSGVDNCSGYIIHDRGCI